MYTQGIHLLAFVPKDPVLQDYASSHLSKDTFTLLLIFVKNATPIILFNKKFKFRNILILLCQNARVQNLANLVVHNFVDFFDTHRAVD